MVVRSKEIFMDSSQWQQRLMQMDRGLKVAEHQNRMATSCAQPLLEQRPTMKISAPPIQQQHTDSQDPSQNNNTSANNNNHEALKCPRCDSTNTKFCYYNNYSLSQPRHFCKTCRRYWTRGGALRNVPVGGGCRKNKRSKRTLSGLDHLHAASIMASNNSAMSLPMSNMTSDLLSNPFNPNSSFLYGLPSTCNNDINMAFARIQQLSLKNNGEYNLSHGLNSDIHIQGLEYCPSRPSNEDMSSYGMTPNTAINIYEGLDSSLNDASMPWSGSSGSLHHHHMSKVTAPLLQTHSLVGSFENGEQKPKVKIEEDCRSIMGSQWQMTPASNTVDTHAYQSSENNGTSEYWNGANGWPELPSYGSSGPSSSVV